MSRARRLVVAALLAALAATALRSSAARAEPPAAAPSGGGEDEARAHFLRGVGLVEESAWAEALAEFTISRQQWPTWKATKNAAACLRELRRDDEALDLLEALLREFPELPAGARDEITLAAKQLEASVGVLLIEDREPGAAVVVDGRYRGELPIASALRVAAGAHIVRISKGGFEPLEARVVVAAGQEVRFADRLRALASSRRPAVVEEKGRARDVIMNSAVVGKSALITIELGASAFVAPSFGGDLSRGCTGACSAGIALGGEAVLRGGVELRSGLGFGLAGGVLAANQTTTGRATTLAPIGLAPTSGVVDDTRKLRGVLAGAWGAYAFGERRVVRLRLGGGALIGALGDSRTGAFSPSGAPSYTIGPVGDAPKATFLYLEPEARAGLRVSEHIELTAAIGALVLFGTSRPTWDEAHAVNAARDGTAYFAPETLAGSVIVAFTPGIGVRGEL